MLGFVLADTNITDLRQRAYVLATIKHECAQKWVPIREFGGPSYWSKYEGRSEIGNTQLGDGVRFHGRGFVMPTGRGTYDRLGKALGIDLVSNPDLALNDNISYEIASVGMRLGLFTQGGRSLARYIPPGGPPDYVNARRVVNGTDKAELIASYAEHYEKLLRLIREGT